MEERIPSRDDITAELIATTLAAMEKDPLAQPPTIKVEIAHPGIDRKNSSPRSEAAFREAIRRALVIAKVSALPPGWRSWPNGWNEANGGQRVTKAEIRIVAYNSRSFGSQSESVIRYELSGRFGLYDERGSGEIIDSQKKRDSADSRVVVSVRAIEFEFVPSWAERVEAGEVGNEPDYTPFGVCVCGHPHRGLVCAEGECMDFVRDPSVASPFVSGGFNDPAAQKRAPLDETPRVQGVRDEDPSPEDVANEDARNAILARMMRGDGETKGGSNSRGKSDETSSSATCECGHSVQRHEDGGGYCQARMCDCEVFLTRDGRGRPLKEDERRSHKSTTQQTPTTAATFREVSTATGLSESDLQAIYARALRDKTVEIVNGELKSADAIRTEERQPAA